MTLTRPLLESRIFSQSNPLRRNVTGAVVGLLTVLGGIGNAVAQSYSPSPVGSNTGTPGFASFCYYGTPDFPAYGYIVGFFTEANANQDFTQYLVNGNEETTTGSSCGTGGAGKSVSAGFNFTPKQLGTRLGYGLLYDSEGNTVTNSYISGVGTGGLPAFSAANGGNQVLQTVYRSGTSHPDSMLFDSNGTFYYISNVTSGTLTSVTTNGTVTTWPTFNGPIAVGLDGGDYVFLLASNSSSGGNSSGSFQRFHGNSSSSPYSISFSHSGTIQGGSIAVDGQGNLYTPGPAGVAVFNRSNTYAITTIASSLTIASVTMDTAGHLWCATTDNKVVEMDTSGKVLTTFTTAMTNLTGILLDPAGNIYVSSYGSQEVIRYAVGTYTPTVVASQFEATGLAMDAQGNLYVGDDTNSQIVELHLATAGLYFPNTQIPGNSGPRSLTVYNAGNTNLSLGAISFASAPAFSLDSSTTTCTTSTSLAPGASCVIGANFTPTVSGAISQVVTVAHSASNVTGSSTFPLTLYGAALPGNKTVSFSTLPTTATAGSTATLSATSSNGDPVTFSVTSGVARISGNTVTYTNDGSVTITAFSPSTASFNSASSSQAITVSGNATGTTLTPQTATMTITTAGTLGQINVLTKGAAQSDFEAAGGGTCAIGTAYTVNQTCTVGYTFAASRPGLRPGAISLTTGGTSSATVLATTLISGTGTGPLASFPDSITTSTIGSSFNHPGAVAVDGSGDVFVADSTNKLVKEIVSVNGAVSSSSTVNTISTAFTAPSGIAVDGSGNVFVSDSSTNLVKEIVAVNGQVTSNSTLVTVGSGFSAPANIALDASDDVFVADNNNNAAKKIVAVNGVLSSASTVNTIGSGFNHPLGIAVDANGDVFVGDSGNNAVKEIVAVSGSVSSSSTVNTVGSNFAAPAGLAVGAGGNIFVADQNHNGIKEIVAVNGSVSTSSTVNTISTGPYYLPNGLAIDGAGNIFVANTGNSNVQQVALSNLPSLSFAQTAVGQTSSDSPQTFHVGNEGNAALVFSVPASGVNPATPTGFVRSASSTCPQASAGGSTVSLAVNGLCSEILSFTPPAAGTYMSPFTLTDNNLGASSTVQNVGLNAVAVQTAQTINFNGIPTPAASGTSVTLSATASSGFAVRFSLISGPATLSGNTLTYTGAGAVVVEADQTGNAAYSAAPPVQQTVHVLAVSPGTSLNGVSLATLTISTAGTIGQINVLTQGAPNLDFKYFSGGSCTVGTAYIVGAQCDVAYTFTPQAIGYRVGGITLTTGSTTSATTLGSFMISAQQSGPLAIFPQSTSVRVLNNNLSALGTSQMVVDGAGNVYVYSDSGIFRIAAVNGVVTSNSPTTEVATYGAYGMALDSFGNLYYSDEVNSVFEIPAVNGEVPSQAVRYDRLLNPPQNTIINSLQRSAGISFDRNNNLYVADNRGNSVVEIMAGTNGDAPGVISSSSSRTNLISNFSHPIAVEPDVYGDVFVLQDNGVLSQVSGGSATSVVSLPSGRGTSLAIDAIDDIFMTDGSSLYAYLGFFVGGYRGGLITLPSGGSQPNSVSTDSNGHLFVADGLPTEIDLTVPPTITFPATAVGSTSATQPFFFINAAFDPQFNGESISLSPALSPGFVYDSSNQCNAYPLQDLVPYICMIDFAPTVTGTTTGTLTFTDNSGNVNGAVQTIPLIGTTTQAAPVLTVSPVTAAYGAATTTLTSTVTTTTTLPTGAMTFQVDGGTAYTPTCVVSGSSETCTYAYPGSTLGLGAHTILFSIAADSTFAANSASNLLTITRSIAVGNTTNSMTATLTFASAATLNSTLATAIQVGAQNNVGLEYSYVSGGTCTPGATYAAGQSCTVAYTFNPEAPGLRLGGINLFNNSSTPVLVASTLFSATGTGPQALLQTGTRSTLSTNSLLYTGRGISVDAAGNVYVADQGNFAVYKYSVATSTWSTIVNAENFYAPNATAVDGAGNLYYVSSPGLDEVVAGSTSPNVLNTSVDSDENLSVDSSGNLYTSDPSTGAIYKLSPPTYTTTTLVAGGAGYRFVGLAIDGHGNLFAADYNNSNLYEVVAGSSTLTLLYSGAPLSNPHAVTVDAAGDVYVANAGGSTIFRFAAGNYTATPLTLPIPAEKSMAIGPDGSIYAMTNDTDLAQYKRTAGTLGAFASTAVGLTSAVRTVALENDGNAALTYSGAASTTANFAVVPGSSTCSATLASSSTCVVGVDFTPKAGGVLTDTLVLTDTSLNANAAMQSVSLSGTGTPGAQTISFPQPQSPVAYTTGVTVALSATASSGLAVTFRVVSGPGTIAGSTLTLTGTGTVVVEADQSGNANYAAATAVQQSVVSTTKQIPVITWVPSTSQTYIGMQIGSGVLDAASTVSGTISYTSTLQPSGLPVSVSAATVLTVGSYILTATLTPTDTTTYVANSASLPFTVKLEYVWMVNGNGTASQLDAGGNAISGSGGYSSAGSAAKGIAIDANGFVWALSSTGVLEYNLTGTALSGSGGYTGGGISSPTALAIDGAGQTFVANANGSISVLSNNGVAVTPATGYTGGNISSPSSIAVDSSGRVWVANSNNSVTEIIGGGAVPVTTPTVDAVSQNVLGVRP